MKLASYNKDQIARRTYISTLEYVGTSGHYNVFRMDDGDKHIVVFDDQHELLQYVHDNIDRPFLLKFLLKSNNKHSYSMQTNKGLLKVTTLAGALSLPVNSTNITVSEKGLIFMD